MCKSNQTAMVMMMMMMMVLRFCVRICARWFVYRVSPVLSRSSVRNINESVAISRVYESQNSTQLPLYEWRVVTTKSVAPGAQSARGSTDKLTALTCVNNCVYACCRLLCAARILQMHTCYANIYFITSTQQQRQQRHHSDDHSTFVNDNDETRQPTSRVYVKYTYIHTCVLLVTIDSSMSQLPHIFGRLAHDRFDCLTARQREWQRKSHFQLFMHSMPFYFGDICDSQSFVRNHSLSAVQKHSDDDIFIASVISAMPIEIVFLCVCVCALCANVAIQHVTPKLLGTIQAALK